MQPALVALDTINGGHFLGSDGRLELTAPAGAVEASDLIAAGGKVSLRVQQIAPASGGNASPSGHYSFGSYLIQVVDANGNLANGGLRKPVSLKLHYSKREQALSLEHVYVLFNDLLPNDLNFNPNPGGSSLTAKQAHIGAPATAPASLSAATSTLSTASPMTPTPSTTASFNTNSADASFGKPDIFNADLSAGALTATYPIDLPAGPGGVKPPVTLAYSSAGVNEQHNPQGAASWVGEGWNLAMGSISWSEHNVAAGCQANHTCSAPNWEDSWQLNDPYGTTGELIPPYTTVKTYYDDMPGAITTPPVPWHSSAEDHAKIWEIQSALTQIPNVPCFRVFLKNGIMEEFGCTYDAGPGANGVPNAPPIQYYPRTDGNYAVTQWFLDLITDPKGNQIHINYQADMSISLGKSFPRDVVIQSIEWDSPNCNDPQNRCAGTFWAPLMQANFAASHSARLITGVSCQANGSLRCDDPIDLSGSQGLVNPTVQSTYVLNDLLVQIRSSGTASWNTLRDYQPSFDQSAQHTVVDSLSGKNESIAGKLTLNQLAELGDDNLTALPTRTFGYTYWANWYTDEAYTAPAGVGCGTSFNSTNCYLWSRAYDGNSYYLTSATNGLGLAQTFGYGWARSNTHGPNADPFACWNVFTNPCNKADSQSWSRLVLTQESGSIVRLTQNGQGGAQTSTAVTTTKSYVYTLATFVANPCSDCWYGLYWGNQKDGDLFDYYNSKFMGFAQATVSNPDGGFEVHKFHSTLGWGVYDCAQVSLGCSADGGSGATFCYSQCHNDPWWPLAGQTIVNALHGHEYEADFYATAGAQTPLKQVKTSYSVTCPPAGVGGSPPRNNGNWNGQLVSELDPSNPVGVCDIQTSQVDSYTYDGTSPAGLPHLTTGYLHDNYGRVTSDISVSNNGGTGSANTIVHRYDYVYNDAVSASRYATSGQYLIDFQASAATEDGSANRYSCAYTSYDTKPFAKGQSSLLTLGEVTQVDRWSNCGTAPNYATSGQQITVTHVYDSYGNQLTTNDPDANAGVGGHQGCTLNGGSYSECLAYDSTFKALLISQTNALNQTVTTNYQPAASANASGGFGLWPVSTTDENTQTTSYTYDALGRRTSQTLPTEPSGFTSVSLAYINTCSGTAAQSPCLEIDHTQSLDYFYFRGRLVSHSTIVSRAFYDGWGHLVEIRTPAPLADVVRHTYYDSAQRLAFESVQYFVPRTGGANYAIPDSTRPGTSHTYDALGRLLVTTDPLSHQTTNNISIACGTISGDSGCYERTQTVDALNHQAGGLVDAFGRKQYLQRFTGNSPTSYAPYATTSYTYDPVGNLTRILHPDGVTSTSFVYDSAGRKTSMTDPDLGTVSYSYDPDGNAIQSSDARGAAGTVYAGYDGVDRPIWRNTSNSSAGAYTTFGYDDVSGGNMGKGRLTSETFTGGPNNSLSGAYSYVYDGRGQETSACLTIGATTCGSASYVVRTYYNMRGDVTLQSYPNGEYSNTNYDNTGWLLVVYSGSRTLLNNPVYAENEAAGQFGGPAKQLTGASLGGGSGTYQYSAIFDALLRPTDRKITNYNSSTTLFDQARTFDAAGNVATINTTLPQGTDNQVFCYDEQDRMTWAGSTGTPPCTGTAISAGTLTAAQYTDWRSYDAMGRLTARPNSFASYGQDTYVYGDPAHLHAATAINGRYLNTAMTAYSAIYDAAGNMTCRDTGGGKSGAGKCVGASNGAQLTYDAEGSLVVWKDAPTNPTTTIGFLYDGHGNRVEQQATQNGTTTTTTYVGNLEEVSTTGATTTTTTYYYAGSARIATSVNGVLSYLGSDGLGSTNVALDASGNATASTLYMPYGWQRYSSGSMPTSYGFTGERSDNATQLDYFNARYYDPVAGQFTTGDTVLPGGGYEILGLSRYAYVDGNPENRTDPSGHLVNPIGPLPDPIPFLRVLPGLLEEGPTVAGAGAAATAEGACVIAEPCGATEVVVLLVIGAGVVVLSVAASSGSQQRIRDQVRSTFKADPASATAKRREALQTLHGNIDNNWVETLQQANEVNPHLGRVRAGGKLPPGPTGRVAIFGLLLVFGGAAGLWVLGEDPVDHNIYRTKDDNPSPSPSPSSPSQPSSKQKLQ